MHSPAPRSRRLGIPPASPAALPTTPADEAGGRGLPFRYSAKPLHSIKPVAGWTLLVMDEDGDEGVVTPAYVARSAQEDVKLDVSRFNFQPTQDRFAWFVRRGFPCPPSLKGGWFSSEIDAAIAIEQMERAA